MGCPNAKEIYRRLANKKRVKNNGIVPQYYIEDNHEAIIPKELFYKVQEEKARRASLNKAAVTRKANKLKKEKSKFSSKYALIEILVEDTPQKISPLNMMSRSNPCKRRC